jgi:hypothetical protein
MKYLLILILLCVGCSTEYNTIEHKDISLRLRSPVVDIDYDSRVCPLGELKGSIIGPLKPLEAIEN